MRRVRNKLIKGALGAGCAGALLFLSYGVFTWHYLANRGEYYLPYKESLRIDAVHTLFPVPDAERLHVVFLGDARWNAATRITALKKAESLKPHLIINLADPVSHGTEALISSYHRELLEHWQHTPLFHIPGGHSRDPDSLYFGMEPYQKFFGQPDYIVKIPEFRLKFIFLDNSALLLFPHQILWLHHELEQADREGLKVILAMHAPPMDPRNKFTKSMVASSDILGLIIRKHPAVIAIFSAHTHENIETTWEGVPLEILGVSGSSADNDKNVKVWSLKVSRDYSLEELHVDVF